MLLGVAVLAGCKKDLNSPALESFAKGGSGKPAPSSPSIIQSEDHFGGSGNDVANGVANAVGGGYFVAGSFNTRETAHVRKYDDNNNLIWQMDIGGNGVDDISSVAATDNGGCMVTGMTNSSDLPEYGGGTDVLLAKISSGGSLEWVKAIDNGANEKGQKIIRTTDGGFAVVGYSGYNLLVIKLDGNGAEVWRDSYFGTPDSYAFAYDVCEYNGYLYVAGTAVYRGMLWGRISLTDHQGVLSIYENLPAGVGFSIVRNHEDNGFLLAGRINCDALVIGVDDDGNYQWEKRFGGSGCGDLLRKILKTDNGYLVLGTTNSKNGDVVGPLGGSDVWLMRLNTNGTRNASYNLGTKDDDEGLDIIADAAGTGYRIAGGYGSGRNNKDMWSVQVKF